MKDVNWYKEWDRLNELRERGRQEAWVNSCVYNVILQIRKYQCGSEKELQIEK